MKNIAGASILAFVVAALQPHEGWIGKRYWRGGNAEGVR
jgi:hypothetical protein